MVRRAGDLFDRVASFPTLLAATQRAARGARGAATVASFLDRRELHCLQLERELRNGTFRPGPTTTFVIRDPKLRTITAVPFRDRVVHHALMAPLEPVFERRMVATTFACRKGKGTHAALQHAQRQARRFRYFLKLDVASFFPSLQHEVVLATLARIVKDRRVLALCEVILRGDGRSSGLPIGSLTSQWFANMVLDRLDHHVVETLRLPGHARYMDDVLLWSDELTQLHAAALAVHAFLHDELRLELKPRATMLAPTRCGAPFLGFLVFPRLLRVRPENLRRYRWRLRHRRWQLERGLLDEAGYRHAVTAVLAHLAHGSTLTLRRRWFAEHTLEL